MDGNTVWVVVILSLTAILCVLIPFIMPWLRKKRIERKCVERSGVLHVPDPRKLIRSYSFFFGGKLLDLLNEKPDLAYIEIDVYSDEVLVYENHNRSSGESFEFIRYRIPFSGFDKTEITDATTGNSGFVFLSFASFSEIYRAFGVEGYYHSETPISVRRDGPGTEVVFCIEPDKGEARKEFLAKIEAVKRTVDQAAKPFRDATKREFDEKNKAADDTHNRLREAEEELFGTAHSASDGALNQGNLALSKKAYDDYSLIVHDAFKLSHEQRKAELIETYKLLFNAAATELQVFFDTAELMANTLMWLICSLGAGNLSSEEKTEIAKNLCSIHEIDDSSTEQLLSQVDDDSSWETVRDVFKLCVSVVRDYDDEAFFQHYRRKTNKKKLSELYVQIYVLLKAIAEPSEEETLEDVAYILNDDPVPSEDEAQDVPEGSDEDDSREVTTIEVENFPYGDSGPKEYESSVDLIGDLIGELLGKPWNLPDGDLPFPVRHLDAEEVDPTRIKVKWEANGREFWLIHEKPRSTCVAEDVRDLVANCLDAIETFFEDEKADQEEDDDQEDDGKNSFLDASDEEADEGNYHIEVPLFAIEPEECASMDNIEISLEYEWNKELRRKKRDIPVNYLGVEEADETHVEIKMEIDGAGHVFLAQKPSHATVFRTGFLQRCVGDFLDELDNEDADNDIHNEGSNETDTTKEEKDGDGGLNEGQKVENQSTYEKNESRDIADDVVYDLSWEPVEGLEDFTYRFVVVDGIKGLEITGYLNCDILGRGGELVINDYYGGYPVLSIAHLQGDYERLILPTTLRFVRDFFAIGKNSKVYKGVSYVGTHDNPYLIAVFWLDSNTGTNEVIMHPDCEFGFLINDLAENQIRKIVASNKLKHCEISSIHYNELFDAKSVLRSGIKKYKNGYYVPSPDNPYCMLVACQRSHNDYDFTVHPDCRVIISPRGPAGSFDCIRSLSGMKSVVSLKLDEFQPVRIDDFPETLMYIEDVCIDQRGRDFLLPKSVFCVKNLKIEAHRGSNSKILLNDNVRYDQVACSFDGETIKNDKRFTIDGDSVYLGSRHNDKFCLLSAGCFNRSRAFKEYAIPSETVVLAESCFSNAKKIGELTIPKNIRDFRSLFSRRTFDVDGFDCFRVDILRFENQFDVCPDMQSTSCAKNIVLPDAVKTIGIGSLPDHLDSFAIPYSCRALNLPKNRIKKLVVNNNAHFDFLSDIYYEYVMVKDGLGKPSGRVELCGDIVMPGYSCYKNEDPKAKRNPVGFSGKKLAENLGLFSEEQIANAKSYSIVKLAIKKAKEITEFFDEAAYQKSRAVCTKGFESVSLTNDAFVADYLGSCGKYHISLSIENKKLVDKCDCPSYGDVPLFKCKHVVGALLYLDALSRGFKK